MSKAKAEARMDLEKRQARQEMTLESDWVDFNPHNPFELVVTLQGDWGKIRLIDPPLGASLKAANVSDDRIRVAGNLKAAFGEALEDVAGRWPEKGAPQKEWLNLVDQMPGSVFVRITDASAAIGFVPVGEESPGNSSSESSPD